jgi:hypothetical protein
MTPPPIQALGITQQWPTTRWKATGYVDGIGWLEAWGTSLITALEALQALATRRVAEAAAQVKEEPAADPPLRRGDSSLRGGQGDEMGREPPMNGAERSDTMPTPMMRWPEAIATLAAERTRAETCVRLLKRHAGGDAAVLSRGELAYAAAKAEMDAVIAGLTVVLAQRGTPPDLAELEARLTRGDQAREAFCREVTALVPPDLPGTRNVLVELVGAFVPALLEAARALYTGQTEHDRLRRQTIQTQLEATQWSAFAEITP